LRDKNPVLAAQHGALLKRLSSVLGILQSDPQHFLQSGKDELDVEKIESLIHARNQARADKNWAEADRIRAELAAMSIELEDGAGGTRWKRVVLN
jgi:cysteinyl-tRNA synthetase